jgi:transposase-like protein
VAAGSSCSAWGGLLSQLTKAVLERALVEEMTRHLGYDKHDPAGRGSGNRPLASPSDPSSRDSRAAQGS